MHYLPAGMVPERCGVCNVGYCLAGSGAAQIVAPSPVIGCMTDDWAESWQVASAFLPVCAMEWDKEGKIAFQALPGWVGPSAKEKRG